LENLIDICADLQRKRIAHRNLKPQNIILAREGSTRDMRLINFELGAFFDDDQKAKLR
jgi:serine/threonine protein kinase